MRPDTFAGRVVAALANAREQPIGASLLPVEVPGRSARSIGFGTRFVSALAGRERFGGAIDPAHSGPVIVPALARMPRRRVSVIGVVVTAIALFTVVTAIWSALEAELMTMLEHAINNAEDGPP